MFALCSVFASCVCTSGYTAFSPDSDLTGLQYGPGCELCRLSPVDSNMQTSLGTTASVQGHSLTHGIVLLPPLP